MSDDQIRRMTPVEAWQLLKLGNKRFVNGTPLHPRQDVEHRTVLAGGQSPSAALFGCSDSRLSAEIIFDMGLGDLFVVRNAGQTVSSSVLGSLEFAVAVLEVPLIMVLGHDECGAVSAAIRTQTVGASPLPPHIDELVGCVVPAVREYADNKGVKIPAAEGQLDASEIGILHLRHSVGDLLAQSELISDAVAEGRLGIVGANYRLSEGAVTPDILFGVV